MTQRPINLNLAVIVHRLLISPRGWRVDELMDELGIRARTYRKYRLLLQDHFHPFRRRDGRSNLFEFFDGAHRYLRLRPRRELGAASDDFHPLTAAVHLTHSLLTQTGLPPFIRGAKCLLTEFYASLRDPDFLIDATLGDAPRMFFTEQERLDDAPCLTELMRAIANRRLVRIRTPTLDAEVAPLSLLLRATGLSCVVLLDGEQLEIDPHQVTALEIRTGTFEYPTAIHYKPSL